MGKKRWIYVPPKPAKPKVPDSVKTDVQTRANQLIESALKPKFIEKPPPNPQFNYLVDIFGKWHQNYFYFCSTYHCPGPHAISPSFEMGFARLEYVGPNQFNLSYMRHTRKWWEVEQGLTLEEGLREIVENALYQP